MFGRTLLLCCLAVLLFAGGCSTTQRRLSAKEYYVKADTAFIKSQWLNAADNYQELLDQYPLNPYAEEAQLKVAYSYYLEEKYTEAVSAFGDFERTYPTSSHLPFVEYFRGLSYLEQLRSIDRDQSVTEKALGYFRSVSDRYADSPFAPLAREKANECRQSLADHELLVADFYQKSGNLFATIVRLRLLMENYPDTKTTVMALARMEDLLLQSNEKQLAALAAQALAVRQSGKQPPRPAVVTASASDAQSSGETDPLLRLLNEVKSREDQARKKTEKPQPPASPKDVKIGAGALIEE